MGTLFSRVPAFLLNWEVQFGDQNLPSTITFRDLVLLLCWFSALHVYLPESAMDGLRMMRLPADQPYLKPSTSISKVELPVPLVQVTFGRGLPVAKHGRCTSTPLFVLKGLPGNVTMRTESAQETSEFSGILVGLNSCLADLRLQQ